ncbi:MAG TPA: hypothetical protein VFU40_08240 [Gemmatimonadales bacterium]|nr:hypothetical protein [Gemmatimonadales bacterium]
MEYPTRYALIRWSALALGAALLACAPTRLRRTVTPPSQALTLDQKSPYLKAHLRSGYVYVLDSWQVDTSGTLVTGRGSLLTANRAVENQGEFRLPVDSVALFETNVLHRGGAVTALSVMTGITAAVTAVCIADPKSCFGSCPTFYVADSTGPFLHAEGFSASIAPALEAVDVDALYRARVTSRDFQLHLRNEALETHVVRYADVLAAPRAPGERVFLTPDGQFRPATQLRPPSYCRDAGGNCLQAVAAFDRRERFSLADSTDLATRETIDLEFDADAWEELGLVVTFRQSLMSTYLLYQTLAYLGTHAPSALAALATGGQAARDRADGLGRLLGRIEVLAPDSAGEWVPVGSAGETGPLAPDTKVIPLARAGGRAVRVRLQLTRGLWRIDYLALARLGEPVQPVRIAPGLVKRAGQEDSAAWRALVDTGKALVTLPGDAYDLIYRLPAHPEQYELFLESRGYYLEWMRREWLAEENPVLAAQILLDPAGALRTLAPAFKRQEPEMEKRFWNSRYALR